MTDDIQMWQPGHDQGAAAQKQSWTLVQRSYFIILQRLISLITIRIQTDNIEHNQVHQAHLHLECKIYIYIYIYIYGCYYPVLQSKEITSFKHSPDYFFYKAYHNTM